MSASPPSADDLLVSLPLPLAQLFRRAQTALHAKDRHDHAYYLAEATLKLAASLRIGVALSAGVPPGSPLARRLEQLCRPEVGEWVGFLRETTAWLQTRPDAALLPLAGCHDALDRHAALPAARAFAESIACDADDPHLPLLRQAVHDNVSQGILGFFTILAAYRNRVIGHGAPKLAAYYDTVGPLLLDAACEVLRQPCLLGGLQLAVCHLKADPSGRRVDRQWRRLTNLGSLLMSPEEVGPDPDAGADSRAVVAGQVYFVAPGLRITLHPLVVYQEDRTERERVGFLNDTVVKKQARPQGDMIEEVRRCEYLDYATGDLLRDFDVQQELTQLLARLRGQQVADAEVARLAMASRLVPADGSTLPAAGATIGDFDLLGELGRGAMGVVYQARQRSLGRTVALKVLPPALAGDRVLLARFWREIAALARCDHPNLVRIITSGSDGDRHYYAMELVEGADLAGLYEVLRLWRKPGDPPLREAHLTHGVERLSQIAAQRQSDRARQADLPTDPLPELPAAPLGPAPQVAQGLAWHARLAELFAQAAEGLAHLHARGILHRDIKPANLMLTADGQRLVVMDLGLARVQDRSRGLTEVVHTPWVGTLRYCAPEQLQWNLLDVDERADIYGLGAALYEMVTLRSLFDGDTQPRLIEQVLHTHPVEPHRVDPSVPPDLSAIIDHCLDKDRGRRYASAARLADDLRRFRDGLPVSVRHLTRVQRVWRWCRRNPRDAAWAATVAIVLLLGGIGLAAGALARQRATAQARLEDARDLAMLKEQIRAERFVEAQRTLQDARERRVQVPALADQQPAWDRLEQVARFYQANDETWYRWGEEDYPGVMASADVALGALGDAPSDAWWNGLPSADLDRPEQERLEQEVYRLLMLASAARTVVGSVAAEKAGAAPEPERAAAAQAAQVFQAALEPLNQAQRWELDRRGSVSIASRIMERVNRTALQKLGATAAPSGQQAVAWAESDNYFLGLMFFVIERAANRENPLCPGEDTGSTASASSGGRPERPAMLATLLGEILVEELAEQEQELPLGRGPLETSERLLRVAAGSERRYWPNFALGRTLFFERKFSEAELAFGTCASLRPDYARSYEQRALMLALQAGATTDQAHREQLERLAREDSKRAVALALQASDPATWWPRGDLLAQLGQIPEALAAYARALEWEDDIRQKVNRRNNVACVRRRAQSLIARTDTSQDGLADAHAVLALAAWALGDDGAAAVAHVQAALDRTPQHPQALTVRGLLTLDRSETTPSTANATANEAELLRALDDFQQAAGAIRDDYYLAALGRARALELLNRWDDALAAWSEQLVTPSAKQTAPRPLALTNPQRVRAHLGRARALENLGRATEAQQALAAARELDPAASY